MKTMLQSLAQLAVGRHAVSTATGALLCVFVLAAIWIINPSQDVSLMLVGVAIAALIGGRGYGSGQPKRRATHVPPASAGTTTGASSQPVAGESVRRGGTSDGETSIETKEEIVL